MKRKSVLVVSLALVLIFTLTACSLSQFLPTGKTDTVAPDSNVLFQDDFSKTSSGWDKWSGDGGSTDYVDGTYQIMVNDTQYDLWANPGENFTDVSVEVDAVMIGGPEDNDFGILCRYVDVDNYYFGIISSDGYYAIGTLLDGTQSIFGENMQPSDAIKTGTESNRIRFDCVGSTLKLYVNGMLLQEESESTLTSGDVGLMAGTFDTAGTQVSFDNFVVTKP
jgi:hypothetical protein